MSSIGSVNGAAEANAQILSQTNRLLAIGATEQREEAKLGLKVAKLNAATSHQDAKLRTAQTAGGLDIIA